MIFSNKNGANTPFLLPYREGIEMKRLNELEEIIGYSFKNKALLELAMTHSSYSNDNKLGKLNNNERLEFLGDAVLELSSSEFLFDEYESKPEGELTRLRASLVCEPTLAQAARDFKLNEYLRLGNGEEKSGGHPATDSGVNPYSSWNNSGL